MVLYHGDGGITTVLLVQLGVTTVAVTLFILFCTQPIKGFGDGGFTTVLLGQLGVTTVVVIAMRHN